MFSYYLFKAAFTFPFIGIIWMRFNPTTLCHLTECGKCYLIPALGIFLDIPKRLITDFRDTELILLMKPVKKHGFLTATVVSVDGCWSESYSVFV